MLFHEDCTPIQLDDAGSEADFDFEGTVYTDREFCRMLRHFDTVDDFFAMSFVIRPGHKDWKMMLLNGHWAVYEDSRVTYLDDYLRYVIATWGLVNARDELFTEAFRPRPEPLRYDPGVAAAHVPAILSG